MQEDQTVSFQPMYVDGPQPWFTQLFVLYLLVVLVVFLVRLIKLAASLRKLHEAGKIPVPDSVASSLWTACYRKAHSFKEISILTFFVSMLNVTCYTADAFFSVRAEKTANINYVLARTADGLVALALGLVFCIALYSAAMLFQFALRRRKPESVPSN